MLKVRKNITSANPLNDILFSIFRYSGPILGEIMTVTLDYVCSIIEYSLQFDMFQVLELNITIQKQGILIANHEYQTR